MSRQMGHMSSECSDRGETAISVPSMMASCGVPCECVCGVMPDRREATAAAAAPLIVRLGEGL